MKLAQATWRDVEAFDRSAVVVVPTGSHEQHGPHLPLATDAILATAVAEGVEALLSDKVVLTPTLWLGASGHHMAFPGTITASFDAYDAALRSVVDSMMAHGFSKFFVLNGHGGNNEPNGVALRKLKAEHPSATFAHSGYFALIKQEVAQILTGPLKEMRHACEAEASLMLHVRPEWVRVDKLRDDGLRTEPPVTTAIHHFDQSTEEGSFGYATFATADKGRRMFELAVAAVRREVETLCDGYVLVGDPRP